MNLHPLAVAWLTRLDAVAAQLPADRAAELRADLVDHLTEAIRPDSTDDEVRGVLRDLGEPEELVAEAAADLAPTDAAPGALVPAAPAPVATAAPDTRREAVALVLLLGSLVLLFFPPAAALAWLGGVALMYSSRVWTGVDKVWGTFIAFGPVVTVVGALAAFRAVSCDSVAQDEVRVQPDGDVGPLVPERVAECAQPAVDWIMMGLFGALLLATIYAVFRLGYRLRQVSRPSGA